MRVYAHSDPRRHLYSLHFFISIFIKSKERQMIRMAGFLVFILYTSPFFYHLLWKVKITHTYKILIGEKKKKKIILSFYCHYWLAT